MRTHSISTARLLRRNVSPAQIVGYIAAALIGLTILAIGARFLSDIQAGRPAGSWLVIQKRVNGLSFGNNSAGKFSPEEINELATQSWVRNFGEFATADFDVYARVSGGGRAMSSALFLESVPDSMLDIRPEGWGFDPASSSEIPVILPREYLSLYNYGFAPSRGLPQISESMASLIPIELSVSGNGLQQTLRGRIAGFSSRINTIAVPEAFIRWANGIYGPGANSAPSRLIVETVSPGDPNATEWIGNHGYETMSDTTAGQIGSIASAGSAVVMLAGSLIVALALFILIISIHLLLYKNRTILFDLMQLGYTPGRVSRVYMISVTVIDITLGATAVILACLVRPLWTAPLQSAGLPGGSVWLCILITAIAVSLLSSVSILTIRHLTRLAFRK